MKKNTNRIILILLTVVMMIGVWSTLALATSPSEVDPSDTLVVSIKTADGTTDLYTYSLSEMNGLAEGTNIAYSSIDSMPSTVKTVASGVYVKDLLDDVQKHLDDLPQYTGLDVWDFAKLKFIATDGAIGSFTYDDLFDIRYYYPDLEKYGLNEDGEIAGSVGDGILVDPMLSITATQERLPDPGSGDSRCTNPERFTILFGMSEEELENVKKRTSDFKRGVCKLVIDMGSYSTAVSGISLEQSSATIAVGKKLQLTATIDPATAANQDVTWATSDAAVASVSSSGLVAGLATGTVTITATSAGDSMKSVTCTITVTQASADQDQEIAVTGIVLGKSQLTLAVGGESTLTATVSPSNATNPTVTWSSSATAIATVDQNGVVKGIKEGIAKITATSGGKSAVCTVTVSNTVVKVTGIKLNNTSLTLAKGKQYQLTPTFSPANATNTTVFWSSDAPGVVSVDTAGLLTVKNPGSAVISVMTEDGSFTAKCTVTVSATAEAFSDISGNWAQDEIKEMVDLGLTSGYSDGTFRPNDTITRAEFISMLVRVLEKTQNVEVQSGSTFEDTNSHWAKDYISTAVALGITNGYGNNEFGPNDKITREQIALMLSTAAGYDTNQPAVAFTDSGSIAAWAQAAVAYTASEGLFSGYADGSFGPEKNATRAEVSALLMRFYEKLKTNS